MQKWGNKEGIMPQTQIIVANSVDVDVAAAAQLSHSY